MADTDITISRSDIAPILVGGIIVFLYFWLRNGGSLSSLLNNFDNGSGGKLGSGSSAGNTCCNGCISPAVQPVQVLDIGAVDTNINASSGRYIQQFVTAPGGTLPPNGMPQVDYFGRG